jgi:hypothetical protein
LTKLQEIPTELMKIFKKFQEALKFLAKFREIPGIPGDLGILS